MISHLWGQERRSGKSVESEWEKFAQKCYSELIDEPEEASTYDQTISAYNDSNDLMI